VCVCVCVCCRFFLGGGKPFFFLQLPLLFFFFSKFQCACSTERRVGGELWIVAWVRGGCMYMFPSISNGCEKEKQKEAHLMRVVPSISNGCGTTPLAPLSCGYGVRVCICICVWIHMCIYIHIYQTNAAKLHSHPCPVMSKYVCTKCTCTCIYV
jgi:hypothetical protein